MPLFAIFETPLAALTVIAGSAFLPVIIHLLNRKRFRIVPWAAMRFLLAAQKKNTRRLRVEHLLLLLIRVFIVLLILLAMASVTRWAEDLWAQALPDGTILSTPGRRRTHRIIVVDGSMSMATTDGETTRIRRALERALGRRVHREGSLSPQRHAEGKLGAAPARRRGRVSARDQGESADHHPRRRQSHAATQPCRRPPQSARRSSRGPDESEDGHQCDHP